MKVENRVQGRVGRGKSMMHVVADQIRRYQSFLITAFARYDGDAVGCELALYFGLKRLGKKPEIIQSKPVPREFYFLSGIPRIQVVPYKDIKKVYDAALIVDSGNFDTIQDVRDHVKPGHPVINIDHHRASTPYGSVNWIEPHRAATGELVYELLVEGLGVPLDKRISDGLYLSLSTDTGRFSFANVTSRVHGMAAQLLANGVRSEVFYKNLYENKTIQELQLKSECIQRIKFTQDRKVGWVSLDQKVFNRLGTMPDDFQEYIELVKSLNSVEVALLLREQDGKIRVSIRTDGTIDASVLAQAFGGGGHKRAAGCTFTSSLPKAEKQVLEKTMTMVQNSNHRG